MIPERDYEFQTIISSSLTVVLANCDTPRGDRNVPDLNVKLYLIDGKFLLDRSLCKSICLCSLLFALPILFMHILFSDAGWASMVDYLLQSS